jgi:hypothetical protein
MPQASSPARTAITSEAVANDGQNPRHITEHLATRTRPVPPATNAALRSLSEATACSGVPAQGRPAPQDSRAVTARTHRPGGSRPCGSQAAISHVRGDSDVISVLASTAPP